MQRFFAFIVTFAYTLQLFSPIIVLAQENESPETIIEVTTSTQDEPALENSESKDEQTDDQEQLIANHSSDTSNPSTDTSQESIEENQIEPNSAESSIETTATSSPSPSPSPSLSSPSPTPTSLPSSSPTPSPLPIVGSPEASSAGSISKANSIPPDDNSSSSTSSSNSDDQQHDQDHHQDQPSEESVPIDVEQLTGDAIAEGQSTNIINTQMQNSCLLLEAYNLTGNENADFSDLICLSDLDLLDEASVASDEAALTATNSADLTELEHSDRSTDTSKSLSNPPSSNTGVSNNANANTGLGVTATTGQNEVNTTGNATVITGDAIALATLQDIVNSSLTNAELFYQVFNIWPTFLGDLILPRADQLLADQGGDGSCTNCTGILSLLQNQARLDQNVEVTANTGNNIVEGENTWVETGDAYAAANVLNLANSQVNDLTWYLLLLNVAGQWTGQLYGWDGGESVLSFAPGQYSLAQEETAVSLNKNSPDSDTNQVDPELGEVTERNQALLTQNVSVHANTGGNTVNASDEAFLSTGNAISIANLFSLINTQITNSRIYLRIVNILGDWKGNIHLAYPELAVQIRGNKESVQLGETVTYTVQYQNVGYDDADDVVIHVEIPAGMEVIAYSQPHLAQESGSHLYWNIGSVAEDAGGTISLTLRAREWERFNLAQTKNSWLAKLIPAAQAANNNAERQVTVATKIDSTEEQSSTKANQASVTTMIYQLQDDEAGQGGDGDGDHPSSVSDNDEHHSNSDGEFDSDENSSHWPIDLLVQHNVSSFVYPLDTVTFTAELTNQGDAPLQEVVLVHEVLQGGEPLVEMAFPLGDLPAHKKGRLQFGLEIPDLLLTHPATFDTRTWIEARTESGQKVSSSARATSFLVQPRLINWPIGPVQPVSAAETNQPQGEVLGDQANGSSSRRDNDRRWWMLSGLILAFILIRIIRRETEGEVVASDWLDIT